jgi:hypothetical protein
VAATADRDSLVTELLRLTGQPWRDALADLSMLIDPDPDFDPRYGRVSRPINTP